METENSFTVKTFLIHIVVGIAAGLLETFTAHFCMPRIPLYMDSIWNVAASLYSLASGITCGIVFQLAVVLLGFSKPSSLVFTICSVTISLTVRAFTRYWPRLLNLTQKIIGVLFLIIALTFLISIEGGLLYILIFDATRYGELSSTNSFVYSFFMQGFPYAFSAIVGRIPVNLADKTIAVLAGGCIYTISRLLQKLWRRVTESR